MKSALAGAILIGLLTLVAGYGVPNDGERWTKVKKYLNSAQSKDQAVRLLRSLVSMKTVRGNCVELNKAAQFLRKELTELGASFPVEEKSGCGQNIFAQIGDDPQKLTVTVYAHFDVVPAKAADWKQKDPFHMQEEKDPVTGEKFYYGRGTSDDKSQVVAWIQAVRAWQQYGAGPPVNIKFILDKEEESGSRSLEIMIAKDKAIKKFLENCDVVMFTDGVGMNDRTPSLVLGLRGINFFKMMVSGPKKNFHSGTYGGIMYEPMTDMVQLLASLQKMPLNKNEQDDRLIRVPQFYDNIEADNIDYDSLDFDVKELKREVNTTRFLYNRKSDILRHLWALPSFSIHSITSQAKGTSIPNSVTATFSFRLVAGQDRAVTKTLITNFLKSLHRDTGSPNKLQVLEMGANAWLGGTDNGFFEAAERAIFDSWGKMNNRVRSGGTIGVISSLDKVTGDVPVIMIPLGRNSDSMHGENERMAEENFSKGTLVVARVLMEFAARVTYGNDYP